MYSNITYILVPICVQYSVQYSVKLRVRNSLHEAGWGLFFRGKMWCRKLFFMYGISFLWSTVSSTVNRDMVSILHSTVYSVMVSTVQVNKLSRQ